MESKSKNKTVWGSLIALGTFFAGKLKFLAFFAKLIKFKTLISMFISVGVYALAYGWKFAVGFVYLLFMHEMGHLIAMKNKGFPVKPAIFIPFVGAVISVDPRQIPNAKVESYIAFGGPILGSIAFLPFAGLYWATNEPLWGVLMFVGAFLNFFNLAPVSPLDGGRIVGVLSPKIWFLGLLGMAVYTYFNPSIIMFLILIFGITALFDRRKQILHHDLLIDQIAFLEKELFAGWGNPEENEWILTQIQQEERRLENLDYFKKRKLKIQMELIKYKKKVLEEKDNSLKSYNAELLMEQFEKNLSADLKNFKSELNRLKGYYKTDAKTKWAVLITYLVLVIFLAIFVGYGHSIMEAHRDVIR
ncbi:site-2 protease family protein [Neobacillus terrae]|uniref:site-2 protease family protein n=1 Tax=Neobacillus terrae TaxID=3034837 RepID=UPI001409E1E3|nr:site-2 protease family protein [Neobacillus terrae]NHM30793.1 site-2 protease family protein [Neobacillus terrae]